MFNTELPEIINTKEKPEKDQSKGLFDHLNNITEGKQYLDETDPSDTKNYVPYMINRFISMDKRYTDIAVILSQYNLDPKEHHDFLVNVLPKSRTFFKYIKGAKERDVEDIELLMKHYKIGKREAKEYLQLISNIDLKTIRKKHQYGKNGKSSL